MKDGESFCICVYSLRTLIDSIPFIKVVKAAAVLYDLTKIEISKAEKGVYSSNVPEYQYNPLFWPFSVKLPTNLPDFCKFGRPSPVYNSCKMGWVTS